jgi:hypothetical protein
MRTALTQENITAIITDYFERDGSPVNFMQYQVDADGALTGAIVDHKYQVDLPPDIE